MEKCPFHEEVMIRVNMLESKEENMETRLTAVEAKVYSPLVLVAVIGLIGTLATVVGSILSIMLTALLKSYGIL